MSSQIEISDQDVGDVWGATSNAPLVVLMEDDLRHSDDTPFCPDADCPCHQDAALFEEFIARPVREGRLKSWEAQELLWPER